MQSKEDSHLKKIENITNLIPFILAIIAIIVCIIVSLVLEKFDYYFFLELHNPLICPRLPYSLVLTRTA